MSTKRYRATHLRAVLDEQGRRVTWVARRAGVSVSLIKMILIDQRTASEDVATKISAALDVPLFFLFECTDVPIHVASVQAEQERIPA